MVWLARRHREEEAAPLATEEEREAKERRPIRTAHYGLGEVGKHVVGLLGGRSDVQMVAAVDTHPLRVGKDLGDVVGLGYSLGVSVSCDPEVVISGVEADVVIHDTTPYLSVASSELVPVLASGKSVISACDELVHPWTSHPDMASGLDATAKKAGVAVLALGASPGFVSGSLPLFLASACAQVEGISVTRTVDLAKEAAAVRAAAGLGMTVDAFRKAADEGAVGLPALLDSVALMAASLGWRLDKLVETIEPVQATKRWETEAAIVEKGRVGGVRQLAHGDRGDVEVLRVELLAVLGAADPHDAIAIRGKPPISVRLEGSIPSDLATAALIVHALPALPAAGSGLISGMGLVGAPTDQGESALT
jgi:hypothetical protein